MKTHRILNLILLMLSLMSPALAVNPPGIINHQGRIAVNGANDDGTGYFKFALVNGTGTTTYWSNDATSNGGSPPASAVPVPIAKGHYAVLLGDTSVANMTTAIPASVFTDNDTVALRLWFATASGGPFERLLPDRRIASTGYSLAADTLDGNHANAFAATAHNHGWVDCSAYSTFSEAVDSIGATKKTLLVSSQQNVSANKTVPSNVTLEFRQGGLLDISPGVILTINGLIDAPLSRIFQCEGSAKVSFGSGAVQCVYSEWWHDGGGDWGKAMNSAMQSLSTAGGKLQLVNRTCSVDLNQASLIPVSNLEVAGVGKSSLISFSGSRFSSTSQVNYGWFFTNQTRVIFKDFSMKGNTTTNLEQPVDPDGAYNLIYFKPIADDSVKDIIVQDCHFSGSWNAAINSYGRDGEVSPTPHLVRSVKIIHSTFEEIGDHGVCMNEWRDSIVVDCTFRNVGLNAATHGMGVDVSSGSENIVVKNCLVDGAAGGFKAESSDLPSKNVIFEGNIIRNLYTGEIYYNQGWYGIFLNGIDVKVVNNVIDSYMHGILVGSRAKDCEILGNTIVRTAGPLASGIRVDGGLNAAYGGHTLEGNHVKNATGHGIQILASRSIVSKNIISYCGRSGVRVADLSDCIIEGNICFDNEEIGIYVEAINLAVDKVTVVNNSCFDTRTGLARKQIKGIVISQFATGVSYTMNRCYNNVEGDQVVSLERAADSVMHKKMTCVNNAPPAVGSWDWGDFALNTVPFPGTRTGWVCVTAGTPGAWLGFGQTGHRSGAGSPSGSVVPNFVGEEWLDAANGKWYKSTGLGNGNWVAMN